MKLILLCTFLLKLLPMDIFADANLPVPPNCGKSNILSQNGGSRIFNGTETKIDEFPWLVYTYVQTLFLGALPLNDGHCTGSLITSDWVLTAAHCIYDERVYNSPKLFRQEAHATLGEYNTNSDPDCDQNGKCAPASMVIEIYDASVHPEYIKNNKRYDIAILRLNRRVSYTPFVQPICLPLEPTSDSYKGLESIMTGWGHYNKTPIGSDIKRKAIVAVTDHATCKKYPGYHEYDEKIHLCVGPVESAGCRGDSGGPLLLQPSKDKSNYYEIGVAIWGRYDCVETKVPTVYMRVNAFIDWIRGTMEGLENGQYVKKDIFFNVPF